MGGLLQHELIMVTGKGGVGKTTLAAALALLSAERGARTIVVELGDQRRLPELFGLGRGEPGVELELADRLFAMTLDPDRVLLEWVQELGGRIPGRVLAGSSTFQYFAAAAPGAKELFAMVKVWELTQGRRWKRRARPYDVVILDAPATGHALGLLRSPQTFGAIARVGPVAAQAERVRELLAAAGRSAYAAVAQGSEMAVSEAIELDQGLREALGRGLDLVIVNGLLPRRFSAAEMERIAALDGGGGGRGRERVLLRAAAHAARSVHERARLQHNQVARLRRRELEVASVPYLWGAPIDLEALRAVGHAIERRV
ncbi:MAG TPA: ArsA-related P-loop ATPase [Solirubrobacteraceae bacterium]|jgi:energy-coupling factor transporter ATP-binding protein EcfA2|nr:ArsA-related P-loop ATPase [Solirubrobacteraceae bacterium]